MWPFTKRAAAETPAHRAAKKLSLINVADYSSRTHSAYWEIGVGKVTEDRWRWIVKILSYADSELLDRREGEAETEEDARRQSQTWVLGQIEIYARPRAEVVPITAAFDPESIA